MRGIFIKSCFAILLALNIWANNAIAEGKKVLILNSYHPNFQWSDALIEGIMQGLDSAVEQENIFIEHLDGRRFADDSLYFKKIREVLAYKYRNRRPDVVISNDDFAFNVLLSESDSLVKGIPVVFTGLNVLPENISPSFEFTGVMEGMDVEGNLHLIFSMYPKLSRLVIIGGGTALDQQHLAFFRELKKDFVSRELIDSVEFAFWINYSKEELYTKVSQLSEGTVILFTSMQRFRDGKYFSYPKHLKEISSLSPVPIFGMYGAVTVGNGLLGGRLNKPVEQGRDAGKMAVQILNGRKPSSIPIIDKLKYDYRFDYEQLKKFGIDKSDLPESSIIDNRHRGFFYLNRYLLSSSFAVFIALILTIVFLSNTIRRRNRAEETLLKFNASLEKTVFDRTAELEASQERLRKSNNDKVKFFSILAHDLRAPFNSIMGFSHILGVDNEGLTLEEAKEYGHSIYDSSQNMFRLLENLLEWSRVMSKTKIASPVHFPLDTIITQNVALLAPGAQTKEISFEIEGDVDATVYADFNMLNSVLQNLLSNALKFTRHGGKIKISVFSFSDNPFVDLLVTDNGVGMSDDARRNLFQIDKTQSTPGTANERGSGLGLMLCKEFVDMSNGEIWVESELGKGSTVTVRLLKDRKS